jgi:hypothetical protein
VNGEQAMRFVATGAASVQVIPHPPENIRLYCVQKNELLMVARGGDTLAQQLALAFAGLAGGALPGGFAALSHLGATGKAEISSHVARFLLVVGAVVARDNPRSTGWIEPIQQSHGRHGPGTFAARMELCGRG